MNRSLPGRTRLFDCPFLHNCILHAFRILEGLGCAAASFRSRDYSLVLLMCQISPDRTIPEFVLLRVTLASGHQRKKSALFIIDALLQKLFLLQQRLKTGIGCSGVPSAVAVPTLTRKARNTPARNAGSPWTSPVQEVPWDQTVCFKHHAPCRNHVPLHRLQDRS